MKLFPGRKLKGGKEGVNPLLFYADKDAHRINEIVSSLKTHKADTTTHGTTGDIVGTTDTQTLTNKTLTDTGTIRAASGIWWNLSCLDAISASPGGSGATLTIPDANTAGGYRLNAANEYVYFLKHVHNDWDAASDVVIRVVFEVNVDNTGGAGSDTVDIQLIAYMKGEGDTATKTQTLEEATVVGASARYKLFNVDFAIDYDDGSNPIDAGDVVAIRINLETDTSEVDDIIVNHIVFKYKTKLVNPEV